jgi:hypothetical protein
LFGWRNYSIIYLRRIKWPTMLKTTFKSLLGHTHIYFFVNIVQLVENTDAGFWNASERYVYPWISFDRSHILHMFDSGKHYKTWLHRNYNRSIFLTQPPRTWAVTRIFLIVVAHKYELHIRTPSSFGTKKRLLQKYLISISWLNTLLFFFVD